MIGPRMSIGNRPHRITLSGPGAAVPNLDGGYTIEMGPLNPPSMQAAIQRASASDIERNFAGTVIATATHLVTMPYHPGVNLQTVIEFNGRTFAVLDRVNREERNVELLLLCAEQVP